MNLSTYLGNGGHGAQMRLAKSIGAYPSDISSWLSGRRKPSVPRCLAIERATAGAVTRRDLRPDDWQLIWPELAQPEAAGVAAGEEGGHV